MAETFKYDDGCIVRNSFHAIFTFSIHTIGEHAPDIEEYIGSKTDSGTNCE
ncbi:hypothetical protein J7J00_12750 [Bacillus sp. ISL-4]|uniref:hypothetical protein n=1 Tax=Bacillus sp. ISL-4 TaxID=2819125 RepID=UPI001BE8C4FB|nr:hypothetical protein [Bacillus sp. ISL-4]MBT2666374.1 hypothetical protein [Bacillus sp. ISL-4]